jgi:hypothetical protein
VSPIEDHAGAVTLGGVLAEQLVADNGCARSGEGP